MSRKFKTADYEATLNQTISIGEVLHPDHLARFVVDVVSQLDLSAVYKLIFSNQYIFSMEIC